MYRLYRVVRGGARPPCVLLLALLLTNVAASAALRAQERGTVTGTVTDAQGLALPGATVVLRTTGRVFVASTVTDRTGGFGLDGVPAGDYVLAASLLGFSTQEEPVTVVPGVVDVDVALAVGAFAQEVSVTALMPELATELVTPASEIERRVAQDLAQSLRGHAGVTAVRRGAINLDPSVRGLYAEQIGVFVDGTRTFAAGHARMDSALSHISPHALQSLRVVRGPYALTWGAGTLSAIQAETFKPAFGAGDFQLGGRAGYNYGSNGGANDGFASLYGSSDRVRFTFQHNARTGSDYTDGNGGTVEGGLPVVRYPLGPRRPPRPADAPGVQRRFPAAERHRLSGTPARRHRLRDAVARAGVLARAGRRHPDRARGPGLREPQRPPDEQRQQADGGAEPPSDAAVSHPRRPARVGGNRRRPLPRRPRYGAAALQAGVRRVPAAAERHADRQRPRYRGRPPRPASGVARRDLDQRRGLRPGPRRPGTEHRRGHGAGRSGADAGGAGDVLLRPQRDAGLRAA